MQKTILAAAVALFALVAMGAIGPTDHSGTASTGGTSFLVQDVTKNAGNITTYVSCVDDAMTVVPYVYDPRNDVWSVMYLAGAVAIGDSVISIPSNMIVPIEGAYHVLRIKNESVASKVYAHTYRK